MVLRLVDYSSDDSSSSRNSNGSGGSGSGGSRVYCPPFADHGHVKGGWAGHVYLQLRPIPALDLVVESCRSTVPNSHAITSLHISLTRPFYLQEHQIASFVSALQRQMATLDTSSLVVAFGGASIYQNDKQSRSFVALDVDLGADRIRRLLELVDAVMVRFNKPTFYADPRFHASIVWADRGAADGVPADTGRLGDMARGLPGIQVDRLVCVVGDKEYAIA